MSNLIPISLAEAALDAQAKQYISKATFDEVWVLYQQALEEVQMLKQANRDDRLKVTQTAALSLADLADKAFYYSREDRASADIIIKTIRTICA
jgi:hypothetical protein